MRQTVLVDQQVLEQPLLSRLIHHGQQRIAL
jgi:hypothetical protein